MSEQKQPAEVGPVELVLGPLPEPWRSGDLKPDTQVYTADACWFYAARAVAAERERCARLADEWRAGVPDDCTYAMESLAREIRGA